MRECYLRVYTRDVIDGQYPDGLAYSIHMEVIIDNVKTTLRNNYGLLFPKADINADNVIVPGFVREAKVCKFNRNGEAKYLITGVDCRSDGKACPDNVSKYWSWITKDFIDFTEHGLLGEDDIVNITDRSVGDVRCNDSVMISEEEAGNITNRWNQLTFKELREDGTVVYSDGSMHKKDFANYPELKFPLARGFGDPVIMLWKNEYYYIATNDNVDDIGLYARKSDTLDGLFADETPMHIILDKDEKRELIQTFWAPEFHVIDGNLYILFAVSNETWGPQCHMMKLKEGGDILKADDWENPIKVKGVGGKKLGENGITLDMTYVKSGKRHYYVWSYREHIGQVNDSGSMLMVAEFDPKKPDELMTEPVCLSRPLYAFENVRGTINNEGPYAFYHDGMIFLAYSGGDARGYLYTVGMLTAKDGDDLCDIGVWEKAKTPILSFPSIEGEYGPGHNSFFCDRNGDWWIAYHAVTSYEERIISDGFRRVHFDKDNNPRFDLAREEDLPDRYR